MLTIIAALLLVPNQTLPTRVLTLDDIDRQVGLSTPEVSPDGKNVALVVSLPKVDDNTSTSEIVLIDIATGSQRTLTYDRKDVASPKWSPTGDRLAFISTASTGVPEIYIMPMNGGDPKPITSAKLGVQQFAWRPDGKAIAFVTQDETPEKKGLDKFKDMFEVGDNDFTQTSAPVPAHLWIADEDGKEPQRLTTGAWTLPVSFPPGPPSSPISWTPDGKSIAIVRQADPHPGDFDFTTIQMVDVAAKTIRQVTKKTRLEAFPQVSPDGTKIAYLDQKDDDWNQNNEAFIAPTEGGEGKAVSSGIDRYLYRAEWMPDSQSLLVAGNDTTQVAYWVQPLNGPAKRLDLGRVSPTHDFWPQYSIGHDGTIAFLANEPDRPTELYVVRVGQKPIRLTDFNHATDHAKIGKSQMLEWRSGKFTVNGLLISPPDFDSAKKYPLLLLIHGGPNSASVDAFDLWGNIMAAHGYLVFEPNYRGSDNLGNDFIRAIEHDAGDGPGRDVMAGLEVVKKLPYVDVTKIAVTGWSYGGYMTSWLIGHYEGWSCAVAGAPMTDLVDSYNVSDGNVTTSAFVGSSPYVGNAMKDYREMSPITYAAKIKTPTLIMCDTGDYRVPIAESYALYHALKDNGTVVKFLAIPVAGHFPGDRTRTKEILSRWIGWVDQYLGGKAPNAN